MTQATWLLFQIVGTSFTMCPLATVGMDANNTLFFGIGLLAFDSVKGKMVLSLTVGTTDYASMNGVLT